MKKTVLYLYRMVVDSNLAPCVDNGTLTLACCKGGRISKTGIAISTGIRYWIGEKTHADFTKDDVYIAGIFKDKLIYIARITHVETMAEYYQSDFSDGRLDSIYSLRNGKLYRNNRLRKFGIHCDEKQIMRDIAGKHVLRSDSFLYLGKDAVIIDHLKLIAPKRQEIKRLSGLEAEVIIRECNKYQDDLAHNPTHPINKCKKCV